MRCLVYFLLVQLSLTLMAADAAKYSWQKPHAEVLPHGGLEWAPEPFRFGPGKTVRYIDFENGDDNHDGASKASAWKHHPWDADATGNAAKAEGPTTYVFKGGVIYRGQLVADESGTAEEPIRLTTDPSWGKGRAQLWGSIRLPQNWKKADKLPKYMPNEGKVWVLDTSGIEMNPKWIDNFARPLEGKFEVFSVFQVKDEETVRLHVAQDPNWEPGNPNFPLSYWHAWDGFFKGEGPQKEGRGGQDEDLKGKPEDFFDGGTLVSQWKGNMGTPCWNTIKKGQYSPKHGTLFPVPWIVGKGTRYKVENVPGYLDAPGEFYFDEKGQRLFLRMPDDSDPNNAVLEVPAILDLIAIRDQSHIVISGLEFRYNRVFTVGDQFLMQISNPACVRIGGNCKSIRVANNVFKHIIMAVSAFPRPDERLTGLHSQGLLPWKPGDLLDQIHVTDNDIEHCEREAIGIHSGAGKGPGAGRLGHAEVLRNRLYEIGFRQGMWRYSAIPALRVFFPETAEIAGNMIDRCWGSAIMVHGGRHGSDEHAPLTRIMVHHNKVENTVLAVNDYGAISLWQGGPIYCYNNISGNCVGHAPDRPNSSPWKNVGYPYYIDGGYKIYTFNNISWGRSNDMNDPYRNNGTYFMVFGFLNPVVNNTFYKAYKGIAGSSGNRNDIIGNLVADIKTSFIASNRMGDPSLAGGGDTGEMGLRGVPSLAYANNLLAGKAEAGTLYSPNTKAIKGGAVDKKISAANAEDLAKQMQEFPIRCGKLGWHTDESPLQNAAEHDFRPQPGSKAIDNGVRYFIPWSLYATVGEWHFNQNQAKPSVAIDYHYYMTEEYIHRKMYEYIPTFDLKFDQAGLDDYVDSPSEDWAPGAMKLDGTRKAIVTDQEIKADFRIDLKAWLAQPQVSKKDIPGEPWNVDENYATFPGRLRKTLDFATENILVEANLRVDRGHHDGVIAGKADGRSGYRLMLRNGAVVFELASGGRRDAIESAAPINDGKWHHVLAEVDRKTGRATIYIDGKASAADDLKLSADAPLVNTADFVVGAGVRGAIDFLRICRGTLADAQTTIEELYEWQTNGPVTRDFCGNKPVGKRDIGAVELIK